MSSYKSAAKKAISLMDLTTLNDSDTVKLSFSSATTPKARQEIQPPFAFTQDSSPLPVRL